jgi:hypothetical protein
LPRLPWAGSWSAVEAENEDVSEDGLQDDNGRKEEHKPNELMTNVLLLDEEQEKWHDLNCCNEAQKEQNVVEILNG